MANRAIIAAVLLSVGVSMAAIAVAIVAFDRAGEGTPSAAPSRHEPAAYTVAFVEEALRRYDAEGREGTVAHYNTPESVDGPWYVFIADENDVMVAHPTIPANVGRRVEELAGPDGYPAGRAVAAAATEDGAWVDYAYLNPATGRVESKHSWVVRHDGLLFGSGWYEPGPSKADPAAYTVAFVDRALRLYDAVGREETVAYYNSPESVDGPWYLFIADENDVMLAHPAVPENVGRRAEEIDGPDGYPAGRAVAAAATEDGAWVDYAYLNPATGRVESKHSWVVRHDGLLFGSGWYEPGPSKADPAAYTVAFVDRALRLYEAVGGEETVAYYNSPESVDGEWYVFIIRADGESIAHPNPEIVGMNLNGPLGTDVTGYTFGPEMLAAPEEGTWVDYVFLNPDTGDEEIKHSWVVARAGLIFGSGWYERLFLLPFGPPPEAPPGG